MSSIAFTSFLAASLAGLLLMSGCATPSGDDSIVEPPLVTAREHYDRAMKLQERGKPDAAIAEYDAAIAKDSSYVAAYFHRATARTAKGDLAGAIADDDRAVYYDNRFADGYYHRGNAKRSLGDTAGALADYNKVIELQPHHVLAFLSRADLAMDRGDLDSALRDFKEAIELDPQCVAAVNGAAKARRLGAKELAAAPTGAPKREVFASSLLSQQPRPMFRTPPVYPIALRRKNITGKAVVEFIVTKEGNVVEAHAVVATHPGFAQAAEAAISQWKFYPGRKDGRAVNTLMQQPIGFDLVDETKK